MAIQKTSQYIEGGASISNEYGTSQENGYSQEYINDQVSGLDNGHQNGNNGWGGLIKKTIRANQTTYTFDVPNNQTGGYIRNAIVMCGYLGVMFIRWTGNNSTQPAIAWKSFNQNVTITHNNGVLTFTFSEIVYGSMDIIFTD